MTESPIGQATDHDRRRVAFDAGTHLHHDEPGMLVTALFHDPREKRR